VRERSKRAFALKRRLNRSGRMKKSLESAEGIQCSVWGGFIRPRTALRTNAFGAPRVITQDGF